MSRKKTKPVQPVNQPAWMDDIEKVPPAKLNSLKPAQQIVAWDMLQHFGQKTPSQKEAVAKVFDRWADQLRRWAVIKGNKLPAEARN